MLDYDTRFSMFWYSMRMKRITPLLLMTALLVGSGPATAYASTKAEALYREALVKESDERDLDAAIDFYRQAADAAGSDRRLVSRARFRMATCYERLGKTREAEQTYLQIVGDSAHSLSEIVDEAKSALTRLQEQERKAAAEAAAKNQGPMTVTRQFHESRTSITLGPSLLVSQGGSLPEIGAALRYRISSDHRPCALFMEAGGMAPMGKTKVRSTDTGSLSLEYQTYVALLSELPHGAQRTAIPEIGAGVGLTSSKIDYVSRGTIKTIPGPYFSLGLHFFPDHIFSLLVQGNYWSSPYPQSDQTGSPAQTQSFDFPSSAWSLGLKMQIKFGTSKLILERAS